MGVTGIDEWTERALGVMVVIVLVLAAVRLLDALVTILRRKENK